MNEDRIVNFKYEIGQRIIDYKEDGSIKRDFTITGREIRTREVNSRNTNRHYITHKKWYQYHCNICGADGLWMNECNLYLSKNGCSCCRSLTVVKGINDFATTHPEYINYFCNIEDAYTNTHGSHNKVWIKCPYCGNKKYMRISDITRKGFSCPSCGDGIPYPEKFVYNLLKQLNVDFIYQYTKTNAKWCDKYRYDFALNIKNELYLCEINGIQHYKNTGFERTLEDEQENDRIKKELALKNGIKEENYIVVDCRCSELKFIKNSIMQSNLVNILNLKENDINWNEIDVLSRKSILYDICNYWNNKKEDETINSLVPIFKLSNKTIRRYLNSGTELGLCYYNAKEECEKNNTRNKNNNKNKKPIEIFDKEMNSLGIFESARYIDEYSEKLFGIKLNYQCISLVCNKKLTSYKGFIFEFYKERNDVIESTD